MKLKTGGDRARQATAAGSGDLHGKPPQQAWPWVTPNRQGSPRQATAAGSVGERPAGISTASHRGRLGWSLLRGVATGWDLLQAVAVGWLSYGRW
uniref:Uncharacterized protein n=1 Tax=Fagus sylvatica TaxID=28930 RepID=A0A2N9G020_FAGSY